MDETDRAACQAVPVLVLYFPRTGHHLFQRMLSGHPEIDILESLTHMSTVVKSTLELSKRNDLEENAAECKELKCKIKQGWENWKRDSEIRNTNGKKVLLEFLTVYFGISPAVQNARMNDKFNRREERTATNVSSPSSNEFWQVDPRRYSSENPSIFPDDFLKSHRLLLMIRHPALSFPSIMRMAAMWLDQEEGLHIDYMRFLLQYHWQRLMYDWCASQWSDKSSLQPLVVDADDLMYNREAVARLCETLGLDPANTKYEWPKTSEVASSYDREEIFQDLLASSTGILPGKSSVGVDVGAEFPKWQAEFGAERAVLLKELVDDAMNDYVYLKEKAIGHE